MYVIKSEKTGEFLSHNGGRTSKFEEARKFDTHHEAWQESQNLLPEWSVCSTEEA